MRAPRETGRAEWQHSLQQHGNQSEAYLRIQLEIDHLAARQREHNLPRVRCGLSTKASTRASGTLESHHQRLARSECQWLRLKDSSKGVESKLYVDDGLGLGRLPFVDAAIGSHMADASRMDLRKRIVTE